MGTGNAFELATVINANPETVAGATTATCAMAQGPAACLAAAANTCSFIQIPGGSTIPNVAGTSDGDYFCGQFLNPTNSATVAAAVTTTRRPFTLRHAVLGNTQVP